MTHTKARVGYLRGAQRYIQVERPPEPVKHRLVALVCRYALTFASGYALHVVLS